MKTQFHVLKAAGVFAVLTLLSFIFIPLSAQNETFKNGPSLIDTDGNVVHAHGVGIIKVDDTYYMIGEDRRNIYSFKGVNMYSSKDLVNWKFENTIISPETHADLASKRRFIERPKIIYSPEIDEYVVWVHWESPNYGAAQAAVFRSPTINGDYSFVINARPNGKMARDCNLFVDDDGTAYFIAAGDENVTLYLHELTSDYLDVTGNKTKLFPNKRREAPVIFKDNGIYYMLSSGLTGWHPNQGAYATATSVKGPWSPLKKLGNGNTWNTQPANIVPVMGTKDTTWIYIGDRWQDPNLVVSKNIFLPLEIDNGKVKLNYVHEWSVDMNTGEWKPDDKNNYIPRDKWKIIFVSSEETKAESRLAKNVLDGDLETFWHSNYSDGVKHPHELIIDMGEKHNVSGFSYVPRQDGNTSGILETFHLYLSNDTNKWGAPVAGGWIAQQADVGFAPAEARFVKLVSRSSYKKSPHITIAEFNLFTNSPCNSKVELNYEINGETQLETPTADTLKVSLMNGQDLKLKVGDDYKYGSTIWTGPEDFYNATAEFDFRARTVSIKSFAAKNAGRYMVTYLDEKQCSSTGFVDVTSSGCAPSDLTSQYSVNGGKWKTGKTINAHIGDKVELAPQPENGIWNWSGCNTISDARKQNLAPEDSCKAIATFTNNCGEKSSIEIEINVNTGSGLGGYYNIKNRKSEKCLRPLNGSEEDGAFVVQYTCENSPAELWKLVETELGLYNIVHVSSGKFADIDGASTEKGAKNTIWPDNEGDNQKWRFIEQNGYYHIKNLKSGLLLDISGGSEANNAKSIQWKDNGGHNQDWILVSASGPSGTGFAMVSENDVVLFPNPIVNTINFSIPQTFGSETAIQVLSSDGRIMKYMLGRGGEVVQIELENLESGIYFLKISDEEKSLVKKFLKM